MKLQLLQWSNVLAWWFTSRKMRKITFVRKKLTVIMIIHFGWSMTTPPAWWFANPDFFFFRWFRNLKFRLLHVLTACTHPNMCPCPLKHFLQLNRGRGQRAPAGVNTITNSTSCRRASRRKRGVGGAAALEAGRRMRAAARADRESQLWHDSDKLPCIYSNGVTWSFGCLVMCFQWLTPLMS